jgi:hypothetical protein
VWRLTLLAASLPGVLVAILFLTLREPSRKIQAGQVLATTGRSLGAFMRANWVTLSLLCGGMVAANVGIELIFTWMPTSLQRAYGMAPAQSGEWLGLTLGVGSLLGVALAGVLTFVLRRRWASLAPLQAFRIGTLAAALILPALLFGHGAQQILVLIFIYVVAAFMANSVEPELMMAVAPNHLRGRIYAIFGAVGVLGSALWPTLVGTLSDNVFHGSRGLLLAVCAVLIPTGFAAPLLLAAINNPFRRTIGASPT